ncbi:carbohydrate kinase family protein [Mesorhizobium sp. KR2-14]|uniref:carbohydrate kinase family protein n=1 Tax=Mesorhizobium sp. KR2-14 TaxID=3156610 RepID=UPI0032B3FC5A
MSVPPLLILGNVNVDLVMGEIDGWPAVGTEIVVPRSEMRPGGSAGNTALALSGMGIAHRLLASVGNDAMGSWLAGGFDEACSTWVTDDSDTTISVGIVHKGGDRVFFTAPGHLHHARLEDLLPHIPPAPTAASFACISGGFLMPSLMEGTRELLRLLRQQGWQTAIDPGWPPEGWTDANKKRSFEWLALVDYALLNAEEVKGLGESEDLDAAIATLSARFAAGQTLVIKNGPEGASAVRDGVTVAAKAPPVTVIDTVGAGDTFNAAFLDGLSRGDELQAALERGVRAASLAISTFPRRYSA